MAGSCLRSIGHLSSLPFFDAFLPTPPQPGKSSQIDKLPDSEQSVGNIMHLFFSLSASPPCSLSFRSPSPSGPCPQCAIEPARARATVQTRHHVDLELVDRLRVCGGGGSWQLRRGCKDGQDGCGIHEVFCCFARGGGCRGGCDRWEGEAAYYDKYKKGRLLGIGGGHRGGTRKKKDSRKQKEDKSLGKDKEEQHGVNDRVRMHSGSSVVQINAQRLGARKSQTHRTFPHQNLPASM
ncbi:hypothetical protein B0H10DRAFT_2183973 [Mycena sp. CBHHK59/15]|nr:hypothetical protein B0H10DRAFT_2183973 [Mycena sp. CBHHK59/15]